MQDSRTDEQKPFRGWKACLGAVLVAPFFTSWYLSGVASANANSLWPVYLVSGFLAIFAVWVTLSSPLGRWAKLVLCLVSVGVQALVTFLGVLVEFLHGGFGLGV